MVNRTRTTSKNAAIGVALLALSGSLLAADIVMTRAVQPEETGASSLALAVPVASAAAVATSPPRAASTLPPSRSARRVPQATFASLITRHAVARRDHPPRARPSEHRVVATSSHARAEDTPLHRAPKARSVVAVERVTRQPAPARITLVAARTVVAHTAPRPSPPRRAGRSAVEAAQYFAVRTVEAQTPGVEHVAAVTRKRGTSRLVVHIIAKTHAGTLVEFEVLRRNGIGFAIESRTSRFVALSTRTKSSVIPSSPARHVAGR